MLVIGIGAPHAADAAFSSVVAVPDGASLFGRVVRLDDVRVETRARGRAIGRDDGDLLEDVDADREVGAASSAPFCASTSRLHGVELVVPAGRADDDGNPAAMIARTFAGAAPGVVNSTATSAPPSAPRDSPRFVSASSSRATTSPAALRGELGDRLPHLAHADDREPVRVMPPPLPKNAACNRRITGFTCSSSTTIVRLMPGRAERQHVDAHVADRLERARHRGAARRRSPAPTTATIAAAALDRDVAERAQIGRRSPRGARRRPP